MHSSLYFVKVDTGIIECTARGVLKVKSDGIVAGDYVEVVDNAIQKVYERKNYFIRPNVANIDIVNIVIANPPKPDFNMIDKLILSCEMAKNVDIVITVNKNDLDEKVYNRIIDNYKGVTSKIISTSALNGQGFDNLKELLKGKLTVFAGQSAVGKSTIINKLFNLQLKTNDVSGKSLRGRHTTTVSQIYEYGEYRIMDTPGFSALKNDITENELKDYYYEFTQNSDECYYKGCLHINEPHCKIKQMVNAGEISSDRYKRYVNLYNQIKEERRRKR